MSAFLSINSAELLIADEKAKSTQEYFGERSRMFNGTWGSTTRYVKRRWDLSTTLYSNAHAEAWARLLAGEGHHWPTNSTTLQYYSSKGLTKTSGTMTGFATNGKFSGYVSIAAAGQVVWNANLTQNASKWTLMVWKGAGAPATTWKHYIKMDDGTKYEDGISYGSAIDFLNVTTDSAKLGDTASGVTTYFSDFVVLPFRITPTMALAFGTDTVAFSSLPKLRLNGAINAASTGDVSVELEKDVAFEDVQYSRSGSWENGKRLNFSLVEV